MRKLSPLLFIVLVLAGCSTTPAVRIGTATVSFDDVVARSDAQTRTLRSMKGEGNLQIESPTFSQSASFDVTILRPDSLELIFKGPFGITVAQALVTRERFQLYNSLQNRVYIGETSPENLAKTVRIGLTFDDILSLFTGGTVLRTDRNRPYETSAEGGDAVFTFEGNTMSRRYVVDPVTKAIRKLQILNDDGAPLGEQSFSSFESAEGYSYPRRIMLTQHTERRRVTLYYEDVEWNTATASSFSFSVPTNAERVVLE